MVRFHPPPLNRCGHACGAVTRPETRRTSTPKILRDRAVWPAREPHKLEVVGSNPTPAPKLNNMSIEMEALMVLGIFAGFCISLVIIFDQEQK